VKVKKGDTVEVIAGKDKGARGKVISAFPRLDRVLVEGVNRVKKHTRIRTTQRGSKTGGMPRSMASTFAASESTPMARIPRAAIAAAIGAPNFPIPITLTLVGMTLLDYISPSGCIAVTQRCRRGHSPKIPLLHIYAHTCFSGPCKYPHDRANTSIHEALTAK